jgi:predicted enzyme related to lactoylglutathione lyase
MDAFKTHGGFSWNERVTPDPEGAARFCDDLFGWRVAALPRSQGHDGTVSVGDTAVGGIRPTPPKAGPMPPTGGCFVAVEEVDTLLTHSVPLGGKTRVPPRDIPAVGRRAVLQGPQGAVLSDMAYSMP